jgi:hypothetical protein
MSGAKLGAANAANIDSVWETFNDALTGFAKPVTLGVASYHLGTFEGALEPTPTTTRTVYAHQTKRRGKGA